VTHGTDDDQPSTVLQLCERGGIDVERNRERLTRLYFAMHLSTDAVVANAIESELLRPERERLDV